MFVEDKSIVVVWPDEHESRFDAHWLKERAFTEENIKRKKKETQRAKPRLWKSDFKIRKHHYEDLMSRDDSCLQFLQGELSSCSN